MANCCDNTLYIYSENTQNSAYVYSYINETFDDVNSEIIDKHSAEFYFTSKWDFPEKEMNELFKNLPDKENIYMRCLSVEYGNDYVAYWKCEDEDGWYQKV